MQHTDPLHLFRIRVKSMDARRMPATWALVALLCLGARFQSPNFTVDAPTPEMAQQIGQAAEQYRRELATLWLNKTLPDWSQPCPITVRVGEQLGAGGATSFMFDRGEVYGWRMTIQGPLNRILDSVLPHEVTHTIFASHFRQPLPRWADEGACTTVEHDSERMKQQKMLIHFLRTGRGISFSHMFRMKEYPSDVMPLYAQGHSLAVYLIEQGGRQKFLQYVADGLQSEQWEDVTSRHYGFANLGSLQNSWLDWVRQGSPPIATDQQVASNAPHMPSASAFAQNTQPVNNNNAAVNNTPMSNAPVHNASATVQPRRQRPEPNLIYRGQSQEDVPAAGPLVAVNQGVQPAANATAGMNNTADSVNDSGWMPERLRSGGSEFRTPDRGVAASSYASNNNPTSSSPAASEVASEVASTPAEKLPANGWQPKGGRIPPHLLAENNSSPTRSEVGKPQPTERPQQTIIEWQQPEVTPPSGSTPPAPPQAARNWNGGLRRLFR